MREVRSQGTNTAGKDAVSTDTSAGPTTNNVPSISLPKGGGAIKGIGEKFAANPVTGTGSLSIPIVASPGRSGFGPQLSLSYDSGAGNGPFGFGWSLSLPAITRKTDKGLPRYQDANESDVFILSGAEDLVPVLQPDGNRFKDDTSAPGFSIHRYRPRIEGLFARIERWTNVSGETHWRSITKDNVTTLYGKTSESRITDSNDRVFSWLICESYDDKGNAILYTYAGEDSLGIDLSQANESNRTGESRSTNRYLKRIKYGNLKSRLIEPDLSTSTAKWLFELVFDYGEGHYEALPIDANGRRFVRAKKDGSLNWPVRRDAFSSHRAGFEVRTYRLCRRVLMFHHFPEELGADDYLVRSTGFVYDEGPIASFITSVTQSGYVSADGGTFLEKSLPPLEFEYTAATVRQEIREIDPKSFENLPIGIDGAQYQWIDLDGEGLSGILSEQGSAWFYKPNLGEGSFGSLQTVQTLPAVAAGASPKHQFLDLAGDGQLDVVQFAGPVSGFYERTEDAQWNPFTPFSSIPNIDWGDPNLRFVDLTGDGHADILITEDDAFTWFASLAEEGFGSSELIRQALNEEKGPRLVFADGTQSIYLADMSGDGLTDLARIRNGEVCYWPNLGYGRFGARVTMDNAPWFESLDLFDQRRIRVADIDGSGTTDIIYLASSGVRLYFNQSGNGFSEARPLTEFPAIENVSSVTAIDLLGNGTACLVWSSPLPGHARRPMRYVDLMGGQKPHLLVGMKNNLGAETRVQYAPSTKFYLEDKLAGNPWITRLPFPVHVVEQVETLDRISRNRFVTRYAYHHGYFDGIEREFRGFGMVEQRDTEVFAALAESDTLPDATNIDAASHVPPVLTKTWFHTGAWLQGERISKLFEHEYYSEGDPSLEVAGLNETQLEAMLLPDTLLPVAIKLQDLTEADWELSTDEEREAVRALKGSILRQEIYALDGTEEQDRPYSVSERNYTIEMLQPRQSNKHAVFFSHPREQIEFHYERKLDIAGSKLADPRVTHAITLEVDGFGNVLKSVAIGYGRRQDDPDPLLTDDDKDKQKRTLITLSENDYTNPVLEKNDDYRVPLLCEARTYELINLASPVANQPLVTNLFRFEEVRTNIQPLGDGLHEVLYENFDATGITEPRRRLIERVRTIFRDDDLTGALPFKVLKSKALPFESYKLAFTPGLLSNVYQRKRQNLPVEDLLPNPVNPLLEEGGYVELDGDGHWWIPSGRVFFDPDKDATPGEELAFAREHFFLPHRFQDPFLNNSFVVYDKSAAGVEYSLLITTTRDAVGNEVKATNDYRVLQPRLATDPNGNRSEVALDALGMVVGTAVMGKETENLGDSLDGFRTDLDDATIIAHLQVPLAEPHVILGRASTRLVYDLHQYERTSASATPEPNAAYTLARETHDADLAPGKLTKIQHSFSYSDGFGREIQKKIQAEPGPLNINNAASPVIAPRWVGSGWTIFNNKGKPVRQYEPFFSATHRFEFAKTVGVSPILFYDPVERAVATLHPNHTYEKVVFDPWSQETWDVNDTVLQADPKHDPADPKNDPNVGDFFRRLPDADYLPTWYDARKNGALGPHEQSAASKAAVHANTPTVAYFDTLGRTFLTIARNKFKRGNAPVSDPPTEEFHATRVVFDIEGNQREVIDAKDRVVMRYDYDMLGNRIHQASMDAGEGWMLNDLSGKPIRAWDSRGHTFRTEYDPLRRPLRSFVTGADPTNPNQEVLTERLVYGEQHPEDELRNLRGKLYLHFDQAGVVSSEAHDFKGNLMRASRRLAREYKNVVNWHAASDDHAALPAHPTAKLDPTILEADLAPVLEADNYASRTRYDALNRPIQLIAPHSGRPGFPFNVIQSIYNEANLLERVHVWLDHADEPAGLLDANTVAPSTVGVNNIDYDAKGQRVRIEYKNGATTRYDYDPDTFRLIRVYTRRGATFTEDCENSKPPPPTIAAPDVPAARTPCGLQNLHYTYDPVGNITHIGDDAQQPIYFSNRLVEPSDDYTYDAIYRLIEATGREHLGQVGGQSNSPIAPDAFNTFHTRLNHPGDGNAMGTYIERYLYDAVGNILIMQHRGSDLANSGWKRCYQYAVNSNRLLGTGKPSDPLDPDSPCPTHFAAAPVHLEHYEYDVHGNMTAMPHLPLMRWDHRDQLQATAQQVVNDGTPGMTWYVYGAAGQRIRKVTERQAAAGRTPARMKERIYLGGLEIYREYNGDGSSVTLERETLHIMAERQRIAVVETRTEGDDGSAPQLIRFQLGNHLSSSSLELDHQGQIISYEEYYPYGSTSYQAMPTQTDTPKRFRYAGKERDEESGFYYYGVRYYAPWLARWVSVDPVGVSDGPNQYMYVRANPIVNLDPNGTQTSTAENELFRDLLISQQIHSEKPVGFAAHLDRNEERFLPILAKYGYKGAKGWKGVDEGTLVAYAQLDFNRAAQAWYRAGGDQYLNRDVIGSDESGPYNGKPLKNALEALGRSVQRSQAVGSAIGGANLGLGAAGYGLGGDKGAIFGDFIGGGIGFGLSLASLQKAYFESVSSQAHGPSTRPQASLVLGAQPGSGTGSSRTGHDPQLPLGRMSDAAIAQHHAIEANARLALDTSLAGKLGLLDVRSLALARQGSMVPARYGQALENLVDLQFRENPATNAMFLRLGGANRPDWVPRTPAGANYNFLTGRNFDLFTLHPTATRLHLGRPYGSTMEPIYYTRPPNYGFK